MSRYPEGTFTVDAETAAQAAQALPRGTVVRPTAATIAATGYRPSSRLVVRQRKTDMSICSGCLKKLERGGRRRTWEEATRIRPGQLYAVGRNPGSELCLGCVEPVDG